MGGLEENGHGNDTYAYAIDVDGTAVGSIGAFRQENIHSRYHACDRK